MKFKVTVFAPRACSYGAVVNRGPFASIESATETAKRETRKQSLINGRSYATLTQYSPATRSYVDVGTIYAEQGKITSEQTDYFPSF